MMFMFVSLSYNKLQSYIIIFYLCEERQRYFTVSDGKGEGGSVKECIRKGLLTALCMVRLILCVYLLHNPLGCLAEHIVSCGTDK